MEVEEVIICGRKAVQAWVTEGTPGRFGRRDPRDGDLGRGSGVVVVRFVAFEEDWKLTAERLWEHERSAVKGRETIARIEREKERLGAQRDGLREELRKAVTVTGALKNLARAIVLALTEDES